MTLTFAGYTEQLASVTGEHLAFKVVLLGDMGVGKTSLAIRATGDTSNPRCDSSLTNSLKIWDYATKIVSVKLHLKANVGAVAVLLPRLHPYSCWQVYST